MEPKGVPVAGCLDVTGKAGFRILQVTDFHSDVEEALNEKTRAAVRDLVARHAPDLLAVTGDIWCGDAQPDAAPMWCRRDLDFLGSLGIPWAFAWGNHDYVGDFQEAQALIAVTPNAIAPRGDGRGSFRIEVCAGGQPRWDLFFLNSGLSWQLPDDLRWFQEESARIAKARQTVVPAIVYFHLPFGNYQRAIDSGRFTGVGLEEVLHWGDDDGVGATMVKAPGNVRACFCGHSHRNGFHFEEDGVIFAYGRATGYAGYGGEDLPKGGTLLELDLASEAFHFETVLPKAVDPPR